MNNTGTQRKYSGVIPAIAVPFTADSKIDEPALTRLATWIGSHDGVTGIVTNGHTGEIFALDAEERAQVTKIVAKALAPLGKPCISAVACEGLGESVRHAQMAKEAGAQAIMIMPPHHWLRFGYRPDHAIELFEAVGKGTGLDLVAHCYPAWTRANYSSDLLAQLAKLSHVKMFKLGTRDMNRYARDIASIREADPTKAILTCHDEYLLASMVQGVDGALVGFASFIPSLIVALWNAVKAGDLKEAMRLQAVINPMKESVYGNGEPTGDAHARLKVAMKIAGIIENSTPRPPTSDPGPEEVEVIRKAVKAANVPAPETAAARR